VLKDGKLNSVSTEPVQRWTNRSRQMSCFTRILPGLRFFLCVFLVSDFSLLTAVAQIAAVKSGSADDGTVVSLPAGVQAVWKIDKAYREATPTRERVCLNGLWRWQPSQRESDRLPDGEWGYFKVPGCWPGHTDYMQKDCQTVFAHPAWKDKPLGDVRAAWYQREFSTPAAWDSRRIALSAEYVNSRATVYLDGKKAGEVLFPGGELDLTSMCRPGRTHVLSLHVVAVPLRDVLLSSNDTNAPREVVGSVTRRGLCGDVFLIGTPSGARVADVKLDTSVRKSEITFEAALPGLETGAEYMLLAHVMDGGQVVTELKSKAFKASDLKAGRFAFTGNWKADKLWDIHTPHNMYQVSLSLLGPGGKVLDTGFNMRFGVREFYIDGRDFYLNGTRLYLSAVPLDYAQIGAAQANYGAAREALERLKTFGINFVYTHNYDCLPGSHLSFAEILRAADDVGMLVAMSQPHFQHYNWQQPDADENNGYARHAEFYVRVSQNHPAIVAYAMSHNATGYNEDMNPDMIDGVTDPRGDGERNYVKIPLRAEAIVKRLDPARIVYHHSSGNLSSMHTSNFYPNFAPIQELSDWFEHWATQGVKPLFTCEYCAPANWDWGMYRGWYKGKREFGSGRVPWDFSIAEWNSQFYGDPAFKTSEVEKKNLRWEARQFKTSSGWHRWDYPNDLNSSRFTERSPIMAMYITDNWRAFRTWGVSAMNPWEYADYWIVRDGVTRGREEFPVDWEGLQQPGLSPDYTAQRYERMDVAFKREDWTPTAAAKALIRNNRPLLAYLAGKPAAFTSKDHLFLPGEMVEKQAIVINNSRETVSCDCDWSFGLPQAITGSRSVTVATGQQERIPLQFNLPETVAPGKYELTAKFQFANRETQEDSFTVHVVPRALAPLPTAKIALFDPIGETRTWLDRRKIRYQSVGASEDLAGYDVLIVGKAALTPDGAAPDIARVRDGLRVLLFEQTSETLEKRFGFRVAEYGLRQVFPRVPDHPSVAGIGADYLRDWHGAATILAPRLTYKIENPRRGSTVKWCDISVTRLWRCGNRGNVASVLIEKPARGDFLPILDGGYSLQFSPLLEYREGKGMILFCQLDVTGRTEADPMAETLARNLVEYAADWKAAPRRTVVYAGDPAGQAHLEAAGVSVTAFESGKLSANQVLVVGPGGGKLLARDAAAVTDWLKEGGNLLAIGLDSADMDALPVKVSLQKAEHISAYFEPFGIKSLLTGIGPADVHNRDPRELPLVTGGATVVGDGVLAEAKERNLVLCQMAPWQFHEPTQFNVRKTYRRASFLVTRLLANMGATGSTPIVARFHAPVDPKSPEKRFLEGLYLDQPEEWDDPYRFFRW